MQSINVNDFKYVFKFFFQIGQCITELELFISNFYGTGPILVCGYMM